MRECKECGGQVSTKAGKCPHCGYARKRRGFWLAAVAVVFVAFAATRGAQQYALENVELTGGEFGGAVPTFSLKNVLVKNRNLFAVKNAQITCVHKDKNGAAIEKNEATVEAVIPAETTASIPELDFGVDIANFAEGGIDIFPHRLFGAKGADCSITAVDIF